MRSSTGRPFLRVAGGLCALAGVFAWISLGWTALMDPEGVTPQSDAGGRLMTRALLGTMLMIAGTVLLHLAQDAAENEAEQEHDPSRRG